MPFQKGQSGNPGGRPKKDRAFEDEMRAREPKALAALDRVLSSKHSTGTEIISAVRLVIEYGRGKAVQRQQIEVRTDLAGALEAMRGSRPDDADEARVH